MDIRQGKSVFPGIAAGRLFVYRKAEIHIEQKAAEHAEDEVARFMQAKAEAAKQLRVLQEKTLRGVGAAEARIFEAHRMLLEDPDFVGGVTGMIRSEHVSAEYAVSVAGQQFADVFAAMEDAYMRERAADIRDIAQRLIAVLAGTAASPGDLKEPVILLAEDLTPSETVQFDRDKILAFVTQKGSANSHTAILARTMNIPCLIEADVDLDPALNGVNGIVDGFTGRIFINPDAETAEEMRQKKEREDQRKALLEEMKGLPTVTKHGKEIRLYANIGGAEDVDAVLANDSEGIGLFRSEFLYIGRDDYPSEEEQFEAYRAVLSKMNGKKVIIRTLDIGADKKADYFGIPAEENPALGFRAIRICLARPEIFKTQLRAIYRAGAYGNAAIMFPMIISVDEVRRAKEIAEEVKADLRAENIPFGEAELGIMVETPAAAIIADKLAEEVDFFSIGTNDLTQYTLAIDRQNPSLERFGDTRHEAVLRLIEYTCKCAHAHGAWCGICGELAADMTLTDRFIEMGIDELSVSPAYTLELRKKIRESDAIAEN